MFNRLSALLHTIAQVGPIATISSNGATNGATIQKSLLPDVYDELVFLVQTGAVTGSPSSFTVVAKVQDSPNGSDWTDVTDLSIVQAATVTVSAANTIARLPCRIGALRDYVRVVLTTTLNGGSSPTVFIYSIALAGFPRRQ